MSKKRLVSNEGVLDTSHEVICTDFATAVTSVFEISMVTQFLVAASTGMMGGVQTSLPLVPEEDMENFAKDYHEWAPAPWSTLPMPAGPFGMTLPGLSPAPIMRVMLAASPLGDLMQSLQSMSASGGDDIDISFARVKSLVCAEKALIQRRN